MKIFYALHAQLLVLSTVSAVNLSIAETTWAPIQYKDDILPV